MKDDIGYWECDYVNKVDGHNFPAESTYESVEYLKDDLRRPIAEAFNLTRAQERDMSFMDLYNWCDVIQSRLFEGVPLGYPFTDQQLAECNQTVLATLMLPMSDPVLCQHMYVSKAIRTFLY